MTSQTLIINVSQESIKPLAKFPSTAPLEELFVKQIAKAISQYEKSGWHIDRIDITQDGAQIKLHLDR